MGVQQVEPRSPPRKARLRNSWKLFVKTCFCWTTTIQRHFPQQQQDQIRRTIVTEQWTLHCWDIRPNSSCSSLWSKKMKNQIRITPVWRTLKIYSRCPSWQTLMSVLAYLAIHITFLARASLDHSWSVLYSPFCSPYNFYCTNKESSCIKQKSLHCLAIIFCYRDFHIKFRGHIVRRNVTLLTLRACLKIIKGNVNQKLSTTEIGNRVGL